MADNGDAHVRVRLNFDRGLLSSDESTSFWSLVDVVRHATVESFVLDVAARHGVEGRISLSLDGCLLPPWESARLFRDNDSIRVFSAEVARKRKFSADDEVAVADFGVDLPTEKKSRAHPTPDVDSAVPCLRASLPLPDAQFDGCAVAAVNGSLESGEAGEAAAAGGQQCRRKTKRPRSSSPLHLVLPADDHRAEESLVRESPKKKKKKKKKNKDAATPAVSPVAGQSAPLADDDQSPPCRAAARCTGDSFTQPIASSQQDLSLANASKPLFSASVRTRESHAEECDDERIDDDFTDNRTLSTSKLSAALTPAEERLLAQIMPDVKRKRRRRPKKKLKDKLEAIASAALQSIGTGSRDVVVRCEYSGRRMRFPSDGDGGTSSEVAGSCEAADAVSEQFRTSVSEPCALPAAVAASVTELAANAPSVPVDKDRCYSDVVVIPAPTARVKCNESRTARIERRSTAAILSRLTTAAPDDAEAATARCAAAGEGSRTAGIAAAAAAAYADATFSTRGDSESSQQQCLVDGAEATAQGNTYYRRTARRGKVVIGPEEMAGGSSSNSRSPSVLSAAGHAARGVVSSTPAPVRMSSESLSRASTDSAVVEQMDAADEYSSCPPLQGQPRVGDRIAYKVIELADNYAPHLSNYKVGTVKGFNQKTSLVDIELDEIPDNKTRNGKFHLSIDYGDEVLTNDPEPQGRMVTERLLSLMEARLLA